MLDYIFFDPSLSAKFKDHLTKMGIAYECQIDKGFGTVQGEVVCISDATDESILAHLQVVYDQLQDELEALLEQTDERLSMNAAGMQTRLKDGTLCTLRVDPEIVTKILTVLEFDQLQAFVDNIAKSVETPDSGHFCHQPNKGEL